MSLTGISANRLELLQIADAVAREKSIDKEIVIEAIEEAIQKGARARYGAEHDIRVNIDQNLTWSANRVRYFAELQHLGPAILPEECSFHLVRTFRTSISAARVDITRR